MIPLKRKLNPCWWLWNDDDHHGYLGHPFYVGKNWPEWFKLFHWLFIRNPLHNFTHYVIGIADRPDILDRRKRYDTEKWDFLWPWPFARYRGRWIEFYIGWRSWGAWGGPTIRRNRWRI